MLTVPAGFLSVCVNTCVFVNIYFVSCSISFLEIGSTVSYMDLRPCFSDSASDILACIWGRNTQRLSSFEKGLTKYRVRPGIEESLLHAEVSFSKFSAEL